MDNICVICGVAFNTTYREPYNFLLYKNVCRWHNENRTRCRICAKCVFAFKIGSGQGDRVGFSSRISLDLWNFVKGHYIVNKFNNGVPGAHITIKIGILEDEIPREKKIDYNNFFTAIYVDTKNSEYCYNHKYILKENFTHFTIKFYCPTVDSTDFYSYYIINKKRTQDNLSDTNQTLQKDFEGSHDELDDVAKIFLLKKFDDEKEILLQVSKIEQIAIKQKFFGQNSYIKSQSRNYVDLTKMTDNFDFINFFIACILDISKLDNIGSICHYNILDYLEFLDFLLEFELLEKTIMVILDIKDFDNVVRIVPTVKAYSDYLTDFIKLVSFKCVEKLDKFVVNKHSIWINGIQALDLIKHDCDVEIFLLNQLIYSEFGDFLKRINMFEMKFDNQSINTQIDLKIDQENVAGKKILDFLYNDDQDAKTEKLLDIINNHYDILRSGKWKIEAFYKIIHGNKNRYKILRAFVTKSFPTYRSIDGTANPDYTYWQIIGGMCSFKNENVNYYKLFETMVYQESRYNAPFIKELKYQDCLDLFFIQ